MKVTRLRLHGFKSFVDAADIPIQPGVTGIVGPNGCGKSNLVEALRFVMGESSYKAMRGVAMDDVIFAGAGNRPPRNMAEVTLVADRDSGPAGPEVVEISRRIEREAGSVFKINGLDVRARDVQLLFADAATGAHSSALVRQGQVAELIAAKPAQRRGILEDAAGISGLHARRNEAEGKLKAAEANLERLDDVMNEIATRLEGLRRQARQAIRYRSLSGKIRTTEATLQCVHWEGAVARLAQSEADLAAAAKAYEAAAAAQAEAVTKEAVLTDRLPGLRAEHAEAAAEVLRLRNAAAEIDRQQAQLASRRRDLEKLRAQTAADLAHEAELGADALAARGRIDDEEGRLRAESEAAADAIARQQRAAEEAAAAVLAAEAEFSAAAGAVAAAGAERAARERAVRAAHAKLRRLDEEYAAVQRQRDKLFAEHGGAAATEAALAALASAEALLQERQRDASAAESALEAARETERRARGPHEVTQRSFAALQSEARTLADLLDLANTKRFRPVIDALSVTPGYERALIAALGDDLDAALNPEAPSFWGPSAGGDADPALPAGAQALSEFVQGPEQLRRRLRQVGVVSTESAPALSRQIAAGQRLVTLEGALWRWDGLRAQPGSATAGARRLEQRSRIAALVGQLKAARQASKKAADLFTTARDLRADAERLAADSRAAMSEARGNVDARRAELQEAERRTSRVAERLSAFAGAAARVEAELGATRTELRIATEALSTLEGAEVLERGRDALQARLAGVRAKAAEVRQQAERAAHDETIRVRRLAELRRERELWVARVARAEERATELQQRQARLDEETASLADDPDAFERERRKLTRETAASEQRRASAAANLAAAEAEHRQLAREAREALEALGQARESRARQQERVIAATARKDELVAKIEEHFGCVAQQLRSVAGLGAGAALPSATVLDGRIAKLKGERERLGSVNLRAEEEARELQERLDAMSSERRDLEEAIKRLRQGIQSLNREGRERLLVAFQAVDGHFRSLFQHLFGGGTAELALTGSDDPLEAGLDIVARPPGKRPHTMTLLSGGEQALTALSLIFAVFLTNPSPICVLDEVDAPLDDANVERFCSLLDDMRRRTDTRFLVVTHNPITMARMDRLYGVTMAEHGVSQVVSVDLETAERFREAS